MGTETHHPHPIHGPRLRRRLPPLILLLQPQRIFRSHSRLLRGFRHCVLLQSTLRIHRARFASAKDLFPNNHTKGLDLPRETTPKMRRRTARILEDSAKWSHLVQCVYSHSLAPICADRLLGRLGVGFSILLY